MCMCLTCALYMYTKYLHGYGGHCGQLGQVVCIMYIVCRPCTSLSRSKQLHTYQPLYYRYLDLCTRFPWIFSVFSGSINVLAKSVRLSRLQLLAPSSKSDKMSVLQNSEVASFLGSDHIWTIIKFCLILANISLLLL